MQRALPPLHRKGFPRGQSDCPQHLNKIQIYFRYLKEAPVRLSEVFEKGARAMKIEVQSAKGTVSLGSSFSSQPRLLPNPEYFFTGSFACTKQEPSFNSLLIFQILVGILI